VGGLGTPVAAIGFSPDAALSLARAHRGLVIDDFPVSEESR
jgi:hypothetical protein